jgi:hypothetical protein
MVGFWSCSYCEVWSVLSLVFPQNWKLTNTAIAGLHAGKKVDTQSGVLVVCRQLLFDLPGVACIGARAIVGECLGPGELVVAAGCCDDVAVRCDLAGEALDWSGDLREKDGQLI